MTDTRQAAIDAFIAGRVTTPQEAARIVDALTEHLRSLSPPAEAITGEPCPICMRAQGEGCGTVGGVPSKDCPVCHGSGRTDGKPKPEEPSLGQPGNPERDPRLRYADDEPAGPSDEELKPWRKVSREERGAWEHGWRAGRASLADELGKWKERAEQAETQLAGCAVAAMGWGVEDSEHKDANRAKPGDVAWSPAYADVVELREKFIAQRGRIAELEAKLAAWTPTMLQALEWRRHDEDPEHEPAKCMCLDMFADAIDAIPEALRPKSQ